MIKKLILLLILLPSIAYAAPSITDTTGTVGHGQELTITGTSFGSHSDNNEGSFTWYSKSPICAKFKDFEDNTIESVGFTIENGFTAEWSIGSSNQRTNSTYSGVRDYVATRLCMLKYNQTGALSTGQLYVSFYWKNTGSKQNGKFWRWYCGDNSSRDNMYTTVANYSDITSHSEGSGGSADYSGYSWSTNTWYFIEVWASQSSNTFELKINNTATNCNEIDYFNNIVFDTDAHGIQWGSIDSDDTGNWEFDDLFVDYTFARVMLGNASEFTACTQLETQVPTSWSTTAINVVVNAGAFSVDDTVYLYVVDSSNNISDENTGTDGAQGYGPLTIGSAADPPAPDPEPEPTPPTVGSSVKRLNFGSGTVNLGGGNVRL